MSYMYPDQVEITNVTRNIIYKTETEGTPFLSKAYIEEEAEINRGSLGSVVKPSTYIFLPNGIIINKGDYIRITKLHGVVILADTQIGTRKKVTKVFIVGVFKNSHIEVECESGN